jgi:DNA-binding response OmpR family regulator
MDFGAGMDDCLGKPYALRELQPQLQQWVFRAKPTTAFKS